MKVVYEYIFIIFIVYESSFNLTHGHKTIDLVAELNSQNSFVNIRKQENYKNSHQEIFNSILNLIERVIKTELDTVNKCLTIVTDQSVLSSYYSHEIQNRIMLPVIGILISNLEMKLHASEDINDFIYTEILKSAVNQDCIINIIWVKYRNTAEKVVRLLINGAKLAIRRNLLKFVFIPQVLEDFLNFHSDAQDSMYFNSRKLMKRSKYQYKFNAKYKPDKYIDCFENTRATNPISEYDLTSVLCMQDMDSIPDVIVIRWKGCTSDFNLNLELLTNAYRDRYPNTSLRILCTWNGKHFSPSDCKAFPDKISNMQGRNLRISTFNWYFPYISMKYKDGTENKLITELSNKLNFTYTFNINEFWGTFEPNGTGKGIHNDLLIGLSDIGIGGMFVVYQNFIHLDFTIPYLLSGITMLVPRPRPLPLWLSIFAPFYIHLWLLIMGCVLSGSLVLYASAIVIRKLTLDSSDGQVYTDFIYCLLTVIGQLTQMPANRWPEEASLRHLLTWQFIFFTLVMTGYKNSLINFLRYRRYEKTIDNAEEFTNEPNLYWTAIDKSWPVLLSYLADSSVQEIHSRYKQYPNIDNVKKAALKGNLAIAVEHLATGGYSGADYIDKDFIASSMWLMTSDLSTTMVAMELRKGLPYVEHFNIIIHRLIEAGIIRQWENLSWLYTDLWRKKLQKITITRFGWSKHVASDPPLSMKASHFLGAFFLLSFGLILSFLILLIEVCLKTSKTRSLNTKDNKEKE